MKKIVFTGGHHNSALAVALKLKSLGHSVLWIGHKFNLSGGKDLSAEYQEVTRENIPFYELKTGRFFKKYSPIEYLKIFTGFIQSFLYLLKIKPDLIVSFGGYLAVPVVITGKILGIPSVTHEQTVVAGYANKAIAAFVDKILLTHKDSLGSYPKTKSVVIGLPLQSNLLQKKYKKPRRKLIYITCGKQGSHLVNQAVFPLIPDLTKKYQVIHQTGAQTRTSDQEKARRLKSSLLYPNRYKHQPYFFASDAAKYLKTATLVISRAGAHTTYELLLLNKRSVIIPIPWVSHNEQQKNAELLKKLGSAVILNEKDLTPTNLSRSITQALKLKPGKTTLVPADATDKFVTLLKPYLAE